MTGTGAIPALRLAYPGELPISARRAEIVDTLRRHSVVVVAGETGSGKTTQLPKMCLEAGLAGRGRIGCTQPRRLAALSISKRVAEELGVNWGREVGCKIRFQDRTARETVVKFMTDGILLTEIQSDPLLRRYGALVIDEAHERSLNIDFILGHLRRLRGQRPDLRVIVTSATIDTEKFAAAFGGAPVIEVSGRMYPVEVRYEPAEEDGEGLLPVEAVVAQVERLLAESRSGDMLVFFATEREIRETSDLLAGRLRGRAEVMPLFGRLAAGDQQRVFAPSAKRKIILSTNIAETSLTLPGIRYVVDAGLARISRYQSRTRTRRLPVEPVSQSSADQRKGRCGRVAEGVCVRLYSEDDYLARPRFTPPEILRANLADVILRMKAASLGEIEDFPFIDPPAPAAIRGGYQQLEELGAIDADRVLTDLGSELARLPVDPAVGRMLLQAEEEGVVAETLVLAAALSIRDPRERPADHAADADAAHRRFVRPDSDLLTLLGIWSAWHDEFERLSLRRLRVFCRDHFLSFSRMREWIDLHRQLRETLADIQKRRAPELPPLDLADEVWAFGGGKYRALHRAILSGLLGNVARSEEGNRYRAAGDREVFIFPGSTLFQRTDSRRRSDKGRGAGVRKQARAGWILACEIVETTRVYARTCARVEPDWIIDLGGHISRVHHSEPVYSEREQRVVCRESIRIHGLEIRRRQVGYLSIDPVAATDIFIREALVEERLRSPHRFIEHNRKIREKVATVLTRVKHRSVGDLDDAVVRIYTTRLESVASLHDLNRVIRKKGGEKFLHLSEADLLGEEDAAWAGTAFPDALPLGRTLLPVDYAFRPGDERDGVTVRIPVREAENVDPAAFDRIVPGYLEEKIAALIRTLPREMRRQLPETESLASGLAQAAGSAPGSLSEFLATELIGRFGAPVKPGDFDESALPDYLRMRVEVIDDKGRTLAAGRDYAAVRASIESKKQALGRVSRDAVTAAWRRAVARWEKHDLSGWTFGDLPAAVPVFSASGLTVEAFPGLYREGAAVSVRLFRTRDDARLATRLGLPRVFELELGRELGWLEKDLKGLAKIGPALSTLAPVDQLRSDALDCCRRHLCGGCLDELRESDFRRELEKAKEACRGLGVRVIDQVRAIAAERQGLLVMKDGYPGISDDVAVLVPSDFLRRTPLDRLPHLPRYLKAMAVRVERRRHHPARDEEREALVKPWLLKVEELRKAPVPADRAWRVEEFRWMVEEYRVSVFAQELGTDGPVSAKRLERAWEEIERGTRK